MFYSRAFHIFFKDGGPAPTMCVHPRSLQHQVVHPSQLYVSTGSTVATFLSQGDLGAMYGYPGPSEPDISEEDSDWWLGSVENNLTYYKFDEEIQLSFHFSKGFLTIFTFI